MMSIFSFAGDVISGGLDLVSGDVKGAIGNFQDAVTRDPPSPELIAEKQRLTALYGSTGGTKMGTDFSQSPGLTQPTEPLTNPLNSERAEQKRTLLLGSVALLLGIVFVFSGKRK
jgi:hypothetical protein